MKSVLIAIRPQWTERIASGQKTIEVRKSAPKEVPFKCYIYCTYGNMKENYAIGKRGKVIGEFVCDKITDISVVVRNCNEDYNQVYHNDECKGSCLTWKELQEYGKGKPLYAWHISNLKIYDKPKELSEFRKPCKINLPMCDRCEYYSTWNGRCENITRAPSNWCYVEELPK